MSVPASAHKTTIRTLESFLRLPGGPRVRLTAYFLYYVFIIVALLLLYGRGDFVTAPFVYQGF